MIKLSFRIISECLSFAASPVLNTDSISPIKDKLIIVAIFPYDISGREIAIFDIYKKPNIEAPYCVIVPDISSSYRFRYKMEFGFPCNGGCPFIREGYYKKSGIVSDYNQSDSVMIKNAHTSSINFSIPEAKKYRAESFYPKG